MTDSIDMTALRDHQWLAKAEVMTEALPFMRRYSGHKVVVKFGGNAMGAAAIMDSFARDMALLHQVGTRPVVVQGGGPQIGDMLKKLGIKSEFVNGLRVTDRATMDVVEMVLSGTINKQIASTITRAGATAVGISGKDGGLIAAQPVKGDLGLVATPGAINTAVIEALIADIFIPVIAPVAADPAGGDTYNINSDTVAGAVAASLKATRLLMLTDVAGVLDGAGKLIPELTVSEAQGLIKKGVIDGGMIPKVETCIDAVMGGAGGAVILDGRQKHAVLVELFTEHGIGTIIIKDNNKGKNNDKNKTGKADT